MHANVYKCYLIEDTKKEKPFAVKFTRESDEEKKQAHVKEFKITESLNHKNIVKSIEFFNNDLKGEIHQVLEYIEGIEVLDSIAQ